jgi:hypothetical protein
VASAQPRGRAVRAAAHTHTHTQSLNNTHAHTHTHTHTHTQRNTHFQRALAALALPCPWLTLLVTMLTMTHCVYKRLLSFRYGDRLERAFFNAAPGCVDREYKQHVYYQSPNMQHIPHDYREYGRNVSDRFQMNESHQPPCCTGNQVCCAPRQHSAAARLLTYKSPAIHFRTSCQRQIQTTSTCHCLPTMNAPPALLLVNV